MHHQKNVIMLLVLLLIWLLNLKYEDNSNHFVSNLCLQIYIKCSSTVDKPMWCSYCQEEVNETL